MKFGQFMASFYENVALFNFHRILCEKDFLDVCMLIWINFDSFAMTYLI